MYLVFDTETNGLPLKNLAQDHPGQPHICQLGAILIDKDGRVKGELNVLVKPEGWSIPAAASAVHGITPEDADAYGLPIATVLRLFRWMKNKAERHVAHNLKFDHWMIRREARGCGMNPGDFDLDGYCTMIESAGVVRIPPTAKMVAAGMDGYKSPNLQEAYRHFFGREFEGAHDAMADVRACRDVFFALKRLELETTGAAA
jgi:DNA polymerase-3 subunit epsilon